MHYCTSTPSLSTSWSRTTLQGAQGSGKYSFSKYPADPYFEFKNAFAGLTAWHHNISQALEWKWGHWGKPDYPQHHRLLIGEIQTLWNDFVISGATKRPHDTFLWWQGRLGRLAIYITAAFITHLVHHQQALPIIDQHNFRGMHALIASARPDHGHKKKPSNWDDIALLKSFMDLLSAQQPKMDFSELDRFLMMYGRNHVVR